jgi:hypothetical protein
VASEIRNTLRGTSRSSDEIVRADAWTERTRARKLKQRPVFSAGYILVGLFILFLALTGPRTAGVQLYGLAGVGIVSGVAYWWAAARTIATEPVSIRVTDAGLVLRLRNDRLARFGWHDSNLELSLPTSRRQGCAGPVNRFRWRKWWEISPVTITPEGAELVKAEASRHDLREDVHRGPFVTVTRFRARQRPGPSAKAPPRRPAPDRARA